MKKPVREIIVEGEVAKIPLTKGYTAIIDVADMALVEDYNWCATRVGKRIYAMRAVRRGKIYTSIRLHRALFVLNDPDMMVDHRDGDGLNNRRANLRICSNSENGCNRGPQSNSTSGVKGVSWRPKEGKWEVSLHIRGVRQFRGHYDSLDEARVAYAEAANKFHGQFARTS